MDFSVQLSAYYPGHELGGRQLYQNMLDQAVLADQHGFDAVSITEHHLINILLMPAPLEFAVKIACLTKQVKIMTSVLVLPLHDMRILAGQLVCADIFTDGRLMLGVGRGAFAFEMERLGVPMATSREKFDESLEVLQALLTHEEVSWNGKYYQFEPLDHHAAPGDHRRAADYDGGAGAASDLSLHQTGVSYSDHAAFGRPAIYARPGGRILPGQRGVGRARRRVDAVAVAGCVPGQNQADKQAKTEIAHRYYGQFDNVFSGDGIVERGIIAPIPRTVSIEETARNLHICTASEMIEQLGRYAQAGVDRFILNFNFGVSQEETMETIQRFAEEVMPYFGNTSRSDTTRPAAAPSAVPS